MGAGFPVVLKNRPGQDINPATEEQLTALIGLARPRQSLEERLAREGEPYARGARGAPSVPTGTDVGTEVATIYVPSAAKCLFVREIAISLSGAASVQVSIGASTPYPAWVADYVFPPGGGEHIFRPGIMLRGAGLATNLAQGGAPVTFVVRNNFTAGVVNYSGSLSVTGVRITDDVGDADKVVTFIGDSILDGNGITRTRQLWAAQVREYLRGANPSIRMALKSVSSSTTSHHEEWRDAGYHDIAQADAGFYAVGVNDARQAVATSVVIANFTAFWTWWKVRYPTATLIVTGPTPLADATFEGRAAGYRAAMAAYVVSVGSPRLRYVDITDAFDRSVLSNFNGNDGIHPLPAGHAAVAARVIAGLKDQAIRLA